MTCKKIMANLIVKFKDVQTRQRKMPKIPNIQLNASSYLIFQNHHITY